MTGDPLRRFVTLTEAHGSLNKVIGDFHSGTGNISDDRLLAPILALLVNQEFGLLFFAVVPAAWYCARSDVLTSEQRLTVKVMTGFLVLWFVWIGYGGAVRPLPRYFAPIT